MHNLLWEEVDSLAVAVFPAVAFPEVDFLVAVCLPE